MSVEFIDGAMLRRMVLNGAALLEQNRQGVDALNVFPVPDGDTGTNMTLTIQSAARELRQCNSDALADVAQAIIRGALKGARGNSGVILSQMLRGFCQQAQASSQLGPREFAECFRAANDMAYKALMKPKEGTILTVGRAISDSTKAVIMKGASLQDVMNSALNSGEAMLQRTPEMLPVLKQAGVVDAGGKGLLYIYTGFKRALDGEEIEPGQAEQAAAQPVEQNTTARLENLEDIRFGYCSEVTIVHLKDPTGVDAAVAQLRAEYDKFADSIVVVGDGELIKVHAHSETPYRVLQLAMQYGEITDIKVDNMREQNRQLLAKSKAANQPKKPISVVSVAAGKGLSQLFEDLLSDEIIVGGQTMNPSIEDICKAIMASGGEHVLVLPNNPNIILAAQQAAALIEDRQVHVIPTRSMTAGVAALLVFNPEATAEENAEQMEQAAGRVHDGQVTFAVRDTTLGELNVHEHDVIGLANGRLCEVGTEVDDVVLHLLAHLVDDQSEMITLYYGEEVTAQQAEQLRQAVAQAYPQCDVEIVDGGQPLYFYFIAVESM